MYVACPLSVLKLESRSMNIIRFTPAECEGFSLRFSACGVP